MEKVIVGLDVGASLTKVILVDENLKIIDYKILPSDDPRETALRALELLFKTIDPSYRGKVRVIAATGGGSRFLGDRVLGLPLMRINEIEAIGLGGSTLSGKGDCLVVSAGTGTALVVVHENGRTIRHVGGTGVGGGTILGLSWRMLGVLDFKILEEMALRGDPSRVDLTVSDLIGGPIGILPANVTASNFGKILGGASAEDIAAGIFNLVSQTIGVVASMTAKAYNLEDNIVITGMLAKSRVFSRIIHETARLLSVNAFIPENCELASALGSIVAYLRENIY
ncbi:MAG: pantothenate kinase [Candidatus Bathyarchaeia archaeon]